jgi:CMP-N,N'-diacetyllegionaminic acid synthase
MNLNTEKRIIGLIPARQGSERIKHKNIKNFFSHPLLAYAIQSAIKSKLFEKVVVSTDSLKYAKIAKYYGAEVLSLRPKKISSSKSPDYDWINYTIDLYKKKKINFTHFFILRPTNPFRNSNTIKAAWKKYKTYKNCDSLRAVSLVKEHPGKMWKEKHNFIFPLIKKKISNQPTYNSQYKSLPTILVQNASLEISKTSVLDKYKTITGKKIIPYFNDKFESYDINYPLDLEFAEYLVSRKKVKLMKINKKSFFLK